MHAHLQKVWHFCTLSEMTLGNVTHTAEAVMAVSTGLNWLVMKAGKVFSIDFSSLAKAAKKAQNEQQVSSAADCPHILPDGLPS